MALGSPKLILKIIKESYLNYLLTYIFVLLGHSVGFSYLTVCGKSFFNYPFPF